MNITLNCPLNKLSYGYCASYINQELQKLANVSLFPIGGKESISAEEKFVNSIISGLNNANIFDYNAPCIRLFHQFSLAESIGKGPRIGFPIFELDTFTNLEKHHLSSCDYLFVCSKWAQSILTQNNINVPSFVIPLGYDPSIFFPSQQKNFRKTKVFFTAGKWEVRKSQFEIIRAFNKCFTKDDDVELWMMCDNSFFSDQQKNYWLNEINQSKLRNKIRLIERKNTHEEIAEIMRQTDYGVFPSHSEGWGLELCEMLACGKPCIATNYSGHTEFIDENCIKIEPDGLESAYDGTWFHHQGNWAKIKFDDICDSMIELYNNGSAKPFNYKNIHNFTWRQTAELICSILKKNIMN